MIISEQNENQTSRFSRELLLRDKILDEHKGSQAKKRLERIMQVAKRHLIEKGYTKLSINAVIKEAGGSKATITKYFGNKAGLLQALLGDEAHLQMEKAEEATIDADDVIQTFSIYGFIVLKFFCNPDSLKVSEAINIEKCNEPDIGRNFYIHGFSSFIQSLAKQLDRWQIKNEFSIKDNQQAAEIFLGMLASGPYQRVAYSVVAQLSDEEIEAHVDACVKIFFNGILKQG